MLVSEGQEFLKDFKPVKDGPGMWADLGCGEGFFTNILAEKLSPGSGIYAVDREWQKLKQEIDGVKIHFQQLDFTKDLLKLPQLDGLMMANALHYVKDKEVLLENLILLLKEDAQILMIEYETTTANPWVPYPIEFQTLKSLFSKFGYNNTKKIGERRSIYNSNLMYAAGIKR